MLADVYIYVTCDVNVKKILIWRKIKINPVDTKNVKTQLEKYKKHKDSFVIV